MGFGVFGKLPQKRDFIAFDVPRSVLEPFENWLQAAVAASRNELGRTWQELYLVAPIWRFWGGKDIFGVDCTGAIMPSVDRVGRFFPLSILYFDESGNGLVPPSYANNEEWYLQMENRMLLTLEDDVEIEAKMLTANLVAPDGQGSIEGDAGRRFKHGMIWRQPTGRASDILDNLLPHDYRATCAGRTFWWTNGGKNFGPMVFVQHGLPDPYLFTAMITGEIS